MDAEKVVGNLHATGLPPHQQRVMDEQIEVGERLAKLEAFIKASPVFQGLPSDERTRLKTQAFVMGMYWTVLRERIANFPTA